MIKHEDGSVTHTKEEWEDIREDLNWLRALEDAGVDNWEGIDFARELMSDEDEDGDDD